LNELNSSAVYARCIEKVLRECGAMLMDCLAEGKTQGAWNGDQFKAGADELAHNFLADALGRSFPGVPVVSEEDDASIGSYAIDHFIIDPIDGTASFAHGYAGWVTQAAYIREGQPILAGIYAPASDEYFAAISAEGAYCNGRQLSVTGSSGQANSLIDNYPEPRGIALDIMNALGITEYMESGSIALKICRVADGSADLFVKNMTPRDWDVAAPMLILAEAGGVLTDTNGKPLCLGGAQRRHHGIIAAANPLVADQARSWFALQK
jgi:3'(2'), 5'-bisphosphate nucleotidase